MNTRRALSSIAIALFASAALLELLPRLFDIPGLTMRELSPVAFATERANIQPHPYLAYANKPGYRSREGSKHQISHNSTGFRGQEIVTPKPKDTYRVVCIGGSSTYGHGPTSDANTWPARLQAHLQEKRPELSIEVINAGCRGYSTFESLVNYAFRVSDLEPDRVLIYHTVNDMRCALYPGVQSDNTHWRAIWRETQESSLSWSYTYLFWRRYMTDHFERYGDLGNFLIVDFDKNLKSPGSAPGYRKRGAETDLGYHNFRRNLEDIATLATADGASVVIGTQAYRPQASPETNDEVMAFQEMTQILREVANEHGSLLVDIQGEIRDEQIRREGAGLPSLFMESVDVVEVHLLDEGADIVGRLFADALLPE